MLKDFTMVNLLTEFKDLKNIGILNNYFEKNKWHLIKKYDKVANLKYYQLYFGKDRQVDNMYEFGFSYAYDENETKAELKRLINYVIKYKTKSEKNKGKVNVYEII